MRVLDKVDRSVRIFSTPYELAEKFAEEMVSMIAGTEKNNSLITIALSGGSTPELLYSVIGDHFSKSVNWQNVHFFWGDERCVPPDNPESNFGMTERSLFRKINIPSDNIHRIRGESDPAEEVSRYSLEIEEYSRKRDGLPVFDLVILGLGEDGHTASIFPSDIALMESESYCEVAYHPSGMQRRITLTGRIINNADRVTFLVTGRKKAEIVEKILNKRSSGQNLPASLIVPVYGELTWLLDKEAASLF
jgi:6-phosphogluconolactonase